jgi:hypothetical protein
MRCAKQLCRQDAESFRKGRGIKHIAHDAVSSDLVSLSLAQNGWRVSRQLWDKWADTAYPRDQLRSHARRAASGSAGARRGENRTDMVRRLAAMAGKPQRSSSTSRLVKALTDALQVCTLYGNAGLRQHGAWGAVPGSGADTGPLDSGGGLGQRRPRELSFPPRAAVTGAHPMLSSSVPRRTPCFSASITAPPAPS